MLSARVLKEYLIPVEMVLQKPQVKQMTDAPRGPKPAATGLAGLEIALELAPLLDRDHAVPALQHLLDF